MRKTGHFHFDCFALTLLGNSGNSEIACDIIALITLTSIHTS